MESQWNQIMHNIIYLTKNKVSLLNGIAHKDSLVKVSNKPLKAMVYDDSIIAKASSHSSQCGVVQDLIC